MRCDYCGRPIDKIGFFQYTTSAGMTFHKKCYEKHEKERAERHKQ